MKSRMEKYYDTPQTFEKRVEKNEELYNDISKNAIEKYRVTSNATIIKDSATEIDIDEIKKIVDSRYQNPVRRKSIFVEPEKEEVEEEKIITKEYDINQILERAKEDKPTSYEEDRYKKIHNTQYDILKNLNLEPREKKEVKEENEEESLMTLINTITAKELSDEESNPLDILSDLKGSDDTEVIPPMSEGIPIVNEEDKSNVDKSFYTNSASFSKEDFDFIEDLKETSKSGNKAIVWILITIAIIAFVIGAVIIINKYFDLGLF